jgi:hypothetical protein
VQKFTDELRAGDTRPLSITWYCDLFRPSRIQDDFDGLGWSASADRFQKFRTRSALSIVIHSPFVSSRSILCHTVPGFGPTRPSNSTAVALM